MKKMVSPFILIIQTPSFYHLDILAHIISYYHSRCGWNKHDGEYKNDAESQPQNQQVNWCAMAWMRIQSCTWGQIRFFPEVKIKEQKRPETLIVTSWVGGSGTAWDQPVPRVLLRFRSVEYVAFGDIKEMYNSAVKGVWNASQQIPLERQSRWRIKWISHHKGQHWG